MRLIAFNKPFDVLSQFSDADGRRTLKAFIPVAGVYPAGRLDRDSEGLLLLTDSGRLQHRISSPGHALTKEYLVQVDGAIDAEAIARLKRGLVLKDGPARAVSAQLIEEPAGLWPRIPPIRVRQSIPTSWLQLSLDEGRNRQVRRMTAAVGFPTLRLLRSRIGPVSLSALALQPGEWCSIDPQHFGTVGTGHRQHGRPGRTRHQRS